LLIPLLKRLRTGRHALSREIAGDAPVSSVDRTLEAARDADGVVEGDRERGWRLAAQIEWLDEGLIRARCAGVDLSLSVVDETDSTQAEVERRRIRGDGITAVCAELQRSGRGRQGRAWSGAVGCDVLMSVAFLSGRDLARCAGAGLAVGVALRDAFAPARLKWPNDLVDETGAKIGGVLCEARAAPGEEILVKAGVGINVRNPAGGRPGLGRRIASLEDLGWGAGRNAACGAALLRIALRMEEFRRGGFAALRDAWREGTIHRRGDAIHARAPGGEIERAKYWDVGERGEILVSTAGGRKSVYSAEIDETDPLH